MPSCCRPVKLTMPWVTDCDSPTGLPIASTTSPMRSWSERPKIATGSGARSIFSTAKSVSGSRPTILASATRPSASCTRIESALAMTWLFVTMWPASSTITPEPRLRSMRCRYRGMKSPNSSPSEGLTRSVTSRAVYTLTTDGAARCTAPA